MSTLERGGRAERRRWVFFNGLYRLDIWIVTAGSQKGNREAPHHGGDRMKRDHQVGRKCAVVVISSATTENGSIAQGVAPTRVGFLKK